MVGIVCPRFMTFDLTRHYSLLVLDDSLQS
jgi:hypothetical protein